jgi:alpha-beta hydrolase superfamily lysophospholipase
MESDPLVYRTPGTARLAAELLRAIEQIQAHQSEINVPILALHGTADKLANPQGSRDLVATAASTDKTIKIFEGAWHDLAHEPEHAEFVREIVGWVESRLG